MAAHVWRYVVPGAYLVRTRLRTRVERASWAVIFPVPILLLAVGHGAPLGVPLAVAFVLGFGALMSVYEVGYLVNDIHTVKREADPTHRLGPAERVALDRRLLPLAGAKVALAAALLAAALPTGVAVRPEAFALALALIGVAYAAHNGLRGRVNVLTMLALLGLRYGALLVLIVPTPLWGAVVSALALFPLPRTLEYATHARFGWPRLVRIVGDFDRFRALYYVGLTVFAGAAWALGGERGAGALAAVAGYFAAYRGLGWAAVRRGAYARARHRAYAGTQSTTRGEKENADA